VRLADRLDTGATVRLADRLDDGATVRLADRLDTGVLEDTRGDAAGGAVSPSPPAPPVRTAPPPEEGPEPPAGAAGRGRGAPDDRRPAPKKHPGDLGGGDPGNRSDEDATPPDRVAIRDRARAAAESRARRMTAGIPVSGPNDFWRAWALALTAARGPQPLG